MKREAFLVVTIACALAHSIALAQGQPLPPLPSTQAPPPPPPPSVETAPPPPPPPVVPPPPPPMVDATSGPPGTTTVYTPAPPQYAPPVTQLPCGGEGAYRHDGFYFRFSSGIGALSLGGKGPAGSPKLSGFSSNASLALGGTPARGFVAGGVLSAASTNSADLSGAPAGLSHGWSATAGSLAVLVDWFPDEHLGWHVGAMLGFGIVGVDNNSAQVHWSGASLGGEAFGGYDFSIGPQWSLGVQGSLGFVGQAKLQDQSQNDAGYTLGAFYGAIEATLLHH